MNWKLKKAIHEKFGTQAEFARQLGVPGSLVSDVVRGYRKLNKDLQIEWALALRCPPKDLFGDEQHV